MKAITKASDHPAWKAHQELKEVRKYAAMLWYKQGEILDEIQREKHYEYLGYNTFTEYLGSPELGISERSAYRSMGAYKAQIELEIDDTALLEAGVSKFEMIRPFLNEKNKDELLNMAATLSRSDLDIRLHQMYDGDDIPEWCTCEACGHRHLRRATR